MGLALSDSEHSGSTVCVVFVNHSKFLPLTYQPKTDIQTLQLYTYRP